ncbi:LysM peptidoglycan-binding domain-containing protein [Arenibacter sp. GZD-96]|uniref:LysM peptidoglycan-binding domain-containing protein n=1 Tax=Aurantibrevibacter litoralis TaxID=3106030 RepID=UPI003A4DA08B
MYHKPFFSTLIVSAFVWHGYSQTAPSTPVASVESEQAVLVAKDTLAVDTESVEQVVVMESEEVPLTSIFPSASSDKKFNLQDLPEAAKYDSLWMKEMVTNTALFEVIYEEIAQLEIDSVYHPNVNTETLKLRLEQINQKTPFNVVYNPSLENVINSFLTRKRDFLERMLTLSQFYFPMFEQELDRHNIPLEIKYLAVIESALNPRARSRVGATGLWQFMYGTGKMYKLDVNSYVDERSDPIASTKAASKYLAKLYDIFGDWDLALAAYNSGPGNVNKAIRRSGGYTNYWNIRRNLPRETAGYVPAFLAMMYIFEYAEEHGLKGKPVARPYFETDTIHVKSNITFQQISDLVDVDVEELKILNPSYRLDVIPYVANKNYALRLPVKSMGKFVTNEEAIYAYVKEALKSEETIAPQQAQIQGNPIRYRVQSGDVLGKIADRYRVRVSDLKDWNGLRSNTIRVGQRLTIYANGTPKPVKTASEASARPANTAIANDVKVHTVQNGDSLWTISRKYPGISIDNLREWNGISGNDIKPGTKLKLCSC